MAVDDARGVSNGPLRRSGYLWNSPTTEDGTSPGGELLHRNREDDSRHRQRYCNFRDGELKVLERPRSVVVRRKLTSVARPLTALVACVMDPSLVARLAQERLSMRQDRMCQWPEAQSPEKKR